MSGFMKSAGHFFHNWPIATEVFIIVACVLVVNLVSHRVLLMLATRAKTKEYLWAETLLSAINAPLQAGFWLIALSIAVPLAGRADHTSVLSQFFPPALKVAVDLLVMWFCLRLVSRGQHNVHIYARRKGRTLDVTASDAIGKLLRAAIVITALLMILSALDVPISGLLAFGGIGGIAVGFAAQGLVANLFGGLSVYASRPFKVGDFIIMPNNNVDGKVEHIGWRATRVLGFDRRPFYVPNSLFNTAVLINHSRMTNRRISEYLFVRYRDMGKVRGIVEQGNRMLAEYPGIQHDFFAFRFDTCGEAAIKLYLYVFTEGTDYSDYMRIKEDLLLKIADIVAEHGAELAAGVSTIYAPDGIELRPSRNGSGDEPATAGMTERDK